MSFLETFSSIISAPKHLRLPSVGVDISDTSLKYISFKTKNNNRRSLRLAAWGDLDIPADTLARGDVKNPEQLKKVLLEVKEKIDTPYIRVSLPEERAYLFETEIKKGTPYKEIRGLLEFRLEENVPLSPRDAFFDYEIIDRGNDSENLSVSVTAYAKETINGYYETILAAGLIPTSFEVEAQAIARATIPKDDKETHLIVDFGKTRTGIGIVYKNNLTYTSTIDIGGKELSSVLRRQLGERSEAELTEIKNTQGLIRGANSSEVYEALISTMSAIKDEISVRMQYWESRFSHFDNFKIESVILCGGSSNLKGLPSYLSETIGVEAYRANVWGNAFSLEDYIPPIDRRHSFGYTTAIGLALAEHE